ncbi:MAG: Fic family protein [Cytophagales bacterium]|nr:Fic family protein [Cytophagales bacterium]
MYIWQNNNWTNWRYDATSLALPLAAACSQQGRLYGRLDDLGMAQRDMALLDAITKDVIKTSEIEGEQLHLQTVRSSVARRLGVDIGALAPVDRQVEGIVEMVLDATRGFATPLTKERLFGWHAALFPTGYSGMSTISVGNFRDDAKGPMQVISGPTYELSRRRRKVHFEAPPATVLDAEIAKFLYWFDGDKNITSAASHAQQGAAQEYACQDHPYIQAGLAHLWFVTLHPFDDGNGRIARAVGDMALARAEASPHRFYSLSAQIQRERSDYYSILERTQKSGNDAEDGTDITEWLAWFLGCLHRAIQGAQSTVDAVVAKGKFWQSAAHMGLNARQVKVLNRLLDGFEGKLTNSKYAAIGKCSSDTALRDINELLALGLLMKLDGGGRSAGYGVNEHPNGFTPASQSAQSI